MSFSKDGNRDPTSENVQQEDKVNVEEASVNLGYVKKELNEEELAFEHKQYKIALTLENVFGESSTEQRRNRESLIGFLDGDVIMKIETGTVKLEDENKDLIQKNMEQSDCNECGGNYQGYCLNCSSLSHILNNLTPNLNLDPVLNTAPLNMLEVREVSTRQAVFALKTLPKGIILGPFEGIAPIESTTGLQWKIRDRKLVNDQNGNWMKYIESVANPSSRNLDVFQFDGILYFEASREIQEGEELLVCYREEKADVLNSDKGEVFYLVAAKKEEYRKVFACSHCCLGFRLESCLVEHKSKCPHEVNIEDFEIIQCRCCKVWLEKQEHLESHMLHCRENYNRMSYLQAQPVDRNQVKVQEIEDGPDTEAVHGGFKCSQFSNESNCEKNLQRPLKTHKKPFQCNLCKTKFTMKQTLTRHIKNKHTENGCAKDYQCPECTYQTNYKQHYQMHLNVHRGIKPFECGICMMEFTEKGSLKRHIKNKHAKNGCAKDYQCPECTYQTNYKQHYQKHLNVHRGIKPFECGICMMEFTEKGSLKKHIKNKHAKNRCAKDYQCPECPLQTNDKRNYQRHLNWHRGIKPFECGICKMKFTDKGYLNRHIQDKHTENGKQYQCSECSYETNYKNPYQRHLNVHSGIKPFECGICNTKFTQKGSLRMHIKNKHTGEGSAKDYQCSECTYQTYVKRLFQNHLNVHRGTKPFECGICKMKFTTKVSLKFHIKNKHTKNGRAKDYQCSECTFQTNYKQVYQKHQNVHRGIKPFQCYICEMKFSQKAHLKTHIKNKHTENRCSKN